LIKSKLHLESVAQLAVFFNFDLIRQEMKRKKGHSSMIGILNILLSPYKKWIQIFLDISGIILLNKSER